MKKLIFFLFLSTSIFAQDFSVIKAKTDLYSGLITAEKLAENIQQDFKIDEDKVKAIFCWITRNIRYDLDEYYNPNRKTRFKFRYKTQEEYNQKMQEIKDKTVTETLSTRKALCEGYAQTFAKVCSLLNIENKVVEGYVRQSARDINNPKTQPNHSWNAVKFNDKWIFIDATWAAGYEMNGRWVRKFNPYYYNIPKKLFFKTHYPDNSKWRLQVGRMNKKEFYNQPIYQPSFLASNYQLIAPQTGILYRDKEDKIEIELKSIKNTQQIHIGFLGSPYAHHPKITTYNGIIKISTIAPKKATQAFLLIDKKVMLSFFVK